MAAIKDTPELLLAQIDFCDSFVWFCSCSMPVLQEQKCTLMVLSVLYTHNDVIILQVR